MNKPTISFKGVHNFRDIGGYQSLNGKNIKRDMVYRSGHLSGLKKSAIQPFNALGIKYILDLRTEAERAHHARQIADITTSKIINLNFHQDDGSELKIMYQKVLTGTLGNFDFHSFMLSEYCRYIVQHQAELRTIFKLLLEPDNYPLLISCNSGKDRTGTVTALIHFALQVSKEMIFTDYLLSQEHMKNYRIKTNIKLKLLSLFRANTRQLQPLFEANPHYLQAALDTVASLHGSMDNYLESLGMDSKARAELSRILCR